MDVKASLDSAFTRYLTQPMPKSQLRSFSVTTNRAQVLEAKQAAQVGIPEQYEIQNALRPLFGKGPAKPATIGDHPDFEELAITGETKNHYIVTMFMDIEASTRLSLLVDLNQVYRIKNSIICAAIEIVQSFDGHVHRIMGDAVMAFFGGTSVSREQAVIDALNAASLLRYFAEKSVIPSLKSTCDIDTLGIQRIPP